MGYLSLKSYSCHLSFFCLSTCPGKTKHIFDLQSIPSGLHIVNQYSVLEKKAYVFMDVIFILLLLQSIDETAGNCPYACRNRTKTVTVLQSTMWYILRQTGRL